MTRESAYGVNESTYEVRPRSKRKMDRYLSRLYRRSKGRTVELTFEVSPPMGTSRTWHVRVHVKHCAHNKGNGRSDVMRAHEVAARDVENIARVSRLPIENLEMRPWRPLICFDPTCTRPLCAREEE